MARTVIILSYLISFHLISFGQIALINPSFEDEPADATMPNGWWLVESGTTPDILPGFWGVYAEPSDGNTYLGLITRENGTFESIGQRLTDNLQKNVCYSLALDLAHSEEYVGYSTPIKLKIYLGSKRKSKDQLIFESETIRNIDWETIQFLFTPDANYRYLILEAYAPQGDSTKGNILLDNFSRIQLCNRV